MENKEMMNNIKKYRTALGITQSELARKVGVKRETICRIENGNSLSLDLAMKISNVFGVAVNDIFFYRENKVSQKQDKQTEKRRNK